jgi:hypothetical protein
MSDPRKDIRGRISEVSGKYGGMHPDDCAADLGQLLADADALLGRNDRLEWMLDLIVRDFEDNDSPHLSVAAVQAVQAVHLERFAVPSHLKGEWRE